MKRTSILSMVGTAFLMVFLVGCSSIYETTEDNQARSYNQRYRDNDIYYNNNNSPILVQDRFTGKYYYVYPANTYSNDYYGYDRNYYSGRRSYNNGNRTYSNGSSYPTTRDTRSTVTDDQRRDQRANDEAARKQILGKKSQ